MGINNIEIETDKNGKSKIIDLLEENYKWKVEKCVNSIFSKEELKSLSQQFLMITEFQKNIRLKQIAKKKQVPTEQILREVRLYKKEIIRNRETWIIRHFHRTSMKNFQLIAERGKLLSRSKLKEEGLNRELAKWSSNDDIMMTRDKFDTKWNIVEFGFHEKEVIWASWLGVILVFKEDIMDKNDYDITGLYPTVSDLSLQEYCETILVNSEEDLKNIEKILWINNLNISIHIKNDWKRI